MTDRCKKVLRQGFHTYSCSKPASRDGYCGVHHPEAVAKRNAKTAARWDAKRRASDLRYAEQRAERQVLLAAEAWGAHESPDTLAVLRKACAELGKARTAVSLGGPAEQDTPQ